MVDNPMMVRPAKSIVTERVIRYTIRGLYILQEPREAVHKWSYFSFDTIHLSLELSPWFCNSSDSSVICDVQDHLSFIIPNTMCFHLR